MRNWMNQNRKLLVIIIIIILIILLIIFGIFANKDRNSGKDANKYHYDKAIEEVPGTETYSNEELSSSHCLDGICIVGATFYYLGDSGRVEYTIVNKTDKVASGYLNMVFKDQKLLVVYDNLSPGDSVDSKSQYTGTEIKDKNDYVLKKLTKKEANNIIK